MFLSLLTVFPAGHGDSQAAPVRQTCFCEWVSRPWSWLSKTFFSLCPKSCFGIRLSAPRLATLPGRSSCVTPANRLRSLAWSGASRCLWPSSEFWASRSDSTCWPLRSAALPLFSVSFSFSSCFFMAGLWRALQYDPMFNFDCVSTDRCPTATWLL